ncbi:putative metalloprotease CJM1_0395 family protein [Halarcobacter ebronensis]|uniref:SprA-related family protein n=1 Tax=Halarcobacter ebronensis TaxID=1462615 RepID=A0A4Q1ANP7_9BACT|nr:putative metalloprotease CJM1_0395 family protein [Halarcobacter ebronensis]QKF82096.1 SprA family protein [Halarcobacter ebronensis]RXK04074.1 hypothetical protein CRV07_11640 [Halarcobacter ebronensis]
MEAINSVSRSNIYMQLAQKRADLANIDKKEQEKNTQESYDKTNETNSKYDQKDYDLVLGKFKKLDTETKAHEQAHAANAPTTTPINYNYQVGPDGKLYANGGSVRYDTSIPEDEGSANYKLEQLQNAASAPNELSAADAQIAKTANLNRMLLQSQEESF